MADRKPIKNRRAYVELPGNLTNYHSDSEDDDYNMISQSFYDNKNYQSIIECLDGGYKISYNIIRYMEDYIRVQKQIIRRWNSYSNKWRSKLNRQSTLSSYHTTKRAQMQTIRFPQKRTQFIKSQCDDIQQIIFEYKDKVKQMYPRKYFRNTHEHYRSDEMNKLFKTARSSLVKVSNELQILRENKKESEVTNALGHQNSKQPELELLKGQIAQKEKEYDRKRETYRKETTKIYEQCRVLEQVRLNQIRETLIKFIEAIHSSEYSNQQNAMYQQLLSNIKSKQNWIKDLDFWARSYHIIRSTKDTNGIIDDDEITNLTTTEGNVNACDTETKEEEEPSIISRTTTSSRTKPKKKYN